MYLQEIIEVAMGVIFAWLLISLATMQVQEIIARLMKKRAQDLFKAIENMLADQEILADFYEHALIKSLQEPEKKQGDDNNGKNITQTVVKRLEIIKNSKLPSYIPPETFSSVLFDIITKAGTENSPIQSTLKTLNGKLDGVKNEEDKATIKAGLQRIAELGEIAAKTDVGENVQKEIKKELKKQVRDLHKKYEDRLPQLNDLKAQIEDAIDDAQVDWKQLFTSDLLVDRLDTGVKFLLSNDNKSALGQALHGLLAGINEYATATDQAIAVGRKNVEKWFDNSMDRLSGWYKRWAQTVAFFIALAIAAAFNIDSIYMAQELWRNPAMREATSAYIEDFVAKNTIDNAATVNEQGSGTTTTENPDTKTGITSSNVDLATIQAELDTIAFPTGWTQLPRELGLNDRVQRNRILFWLLKLAGWVITAAAAMQGAPFWFDILKKLVNVRSTGTNPKEKVAATA